MFPQLYPSRCARFAGWLRLFYWERRYGAPRSRKASGWTNCTRPGWSPAQWSDIAWRAEAGNQSPLYFYLVWGEVRLLGHHEWTLRLPSLLAGTVLIGAVWTLVRHWTGSASAGLLAALLVAVNRDCIFFAQEARPYALVQLSAVVHAAIFIQLLQRPTLLWRSAFVLGAAWLFYLHYTAFLFLLAEAICLLIMLPCRRFQIAYALPQAARDAIIIALLLLPASTHVLAIARHRDNWTRIVDAWPLPFAVQVAGIVYLLIPLIAVGGSRLWGRRARSFQLLSPEGMWTSLLVSRPHADRLVHDARPYRPALHGTLFGGVTGRSRRLCRTLSQHLCPPLVSLGRGVHRDHVPPC